jgi:C4-dicarboxylate transporter, DctM subunit
MCVNLGIGMATHPLGANLFVAAGLRQTKVETAINKYLAMYIISGLIILLLITSVPDIVMLLPHWTKK